MSQHTLRNRIFAIGASAMFIMFVAANISQAQEPDGHRIVIMAKGGVAFPVGRFGETDPKANPPKTGHKTGRDLGGAIGLSFGPSLVVGVEAGISRFTIDFEGLSNPSAHRSLGVFSSDDGRTTASSVHVFAQYSLNRGYARWQPYATVGLGAGQPRGRVDYAQPVPFLVNDSTVSATRLESDVKTSFSFFAGIGVKVPVNDFLGITVDSRYHSISAKGSGRTDKVYTITGDVIETDVGTDAGGTVRLKAKWNIDWWEILAGVVISI